MNKKQPQNLNTPLPRREGSGESLHPLTCFSFCPVCGSAHFEVNNFKSKRCADCGFVYYANPSSATAAFIRKGDLLLVARRGNEPAKGTLDLPGGFVDMDETAEQGMSREIHEETGLVISQLRYLFSIPNLYLYSGMTIHTLDMFYEAEVPDDVHPQADDDAAELMWMPLREVNPTDFGLKSIRQAVEKYLANR
ncbi:MAG: NUDIX domain-containing protein [Prevotella sp.]|nr:NUDIX domain-containing protein [Prevotella sp.]